MKIVKLYGHLGKTFGRVHVLDVRTPSEAVRALSANFTGFKTYLIENSEPGYRVLLNKTATVELGFPIDTATISIVPVVAGSGKFFGIIAGMALIAGAPYLSTTPLFGLKGLTLAGMASSIGTSLALSGISALLFAPPKPKAQDGEKGPKRDYFNGPINLSQQGNAVPLAYGQITVGSQVVHARIRTPLVKNTKVFNGTAVISQGESYASTYNSLSQEAITVQRSEVIDVISEGEIDSLVGGAQGVYLDGVPMQDPSGTYNVDPGSTFEFRNGTQSQSPVLTALSGVATTKANPNGAKLANNSGQEITITDPRVKLVELTLGTPQLYEVGKNSGKYYPSYVQFDIEVKTAAGATWHKIVDKSVDGYIKGDYRSLFQKSWEVPLDVPDNQYPVLIKVTRYATYTQNPFYQNDCYFYTYTERIPTRLAYPNTALVSVNLMAKEFSSIPSRSYNIKGIKVKVPSNYNPTTRTYTGSWDGLFAPAKVWTDNPVWIYYDLLTNTRYGLGDLLDSSQINKWALYTISKYCDEAVPDGYGGTEPRYTCNIYIQNQEEAYRVLNNLTSIFRAMNYWADGQMTAIADSPSDPVAHFSASNVIDGAFSYSGSSLKARRNVALVTWNDPQDFFRQKMEYVESASDSASIARMSRFGVSQTEVVAVGCTSRGQANRVGRWLLYTEQMETETISFRAALDSTIVSPGEIIQVTDPLRAGERLGGRIISATTDTIYLDAEIPSGIYTLYIFVPYKDSTGVNKPKLEYRQGTVTANIFFTTAAFSTAPEVNTMWTAARTNDTQPEFWRVLVVKEEEDNLVEINAVEHRPDKYAAVENGLVLEARDTTSLNYSSPDMPTNLVFAEYLYFSGPGVISIGAKVSWSSPQSDFIFRYSLVNTGDTLAPVIGEPDLVGDWVELRTNTPGVDIKPLEEGEYRIEVVAVNSLGRRSPTLSQTVTVLGKTSPPGDVLDLAVSTTANGIAMSWDHVTDLDLDGYEIRETYKATRAEVVYPFEIIGESYTFNGGYLLASTASSGDFEAIRTLVETEWPINYNTSRPSPVNNKGVVSNNRIVTWNATSNSYPLYSDNAGLTWVYSTGSNVGTGSPNHGFAKDGVILIPCISRMLRSTDNGSSFSTVAIPSDNYAFAVLCIGSTWYHFQAASGPIGVTPSYDAGTTWYNAGKVNTDSFNTISGSVATDVEGIFFGNSYNPDGFFRPSIISNLSNWQRIAFTSEVSSSFGIVAACVHEVAGIKYFYVLTDKGVVFRKPEGLNPIFSNWTNLGNPGLTVGRCISSSGNRVFVMGQHQGSNVGRLYSSTFDAPWELTLEKTVTWNVDSWTWLYLVTPTPPSPTATVYVQWDADATTAEKNVVWDSLADYKIQSGPIYETQYTDLSTLPGYNIYLIKAIDTSDNYSVIPEATGIKITAPLAPTNLTYEIDGSDIIVRWTAPSSVFAIKRYVVTLDGVNYETNTTVFRKKAHWSGGAARSVSVVAYDIYDRAGPAVTGSITIALQAAPQNLTYELDADYVDVYWDLPTNGSTALALAYYELRTDTNWGSNMNLISAHFGNSHEVIVHWEGPKTLYLAAFDSLHNVGAVASVTINVSAPGAPQNLNSSVVDNNVLLLWEAPAVTPLPIIEYEVRRGTTWETAEVIGVKAGNFTSIFETASGNYTYWIAAISSAKKLDPLIPYGTPASIAVKVNQPPDYILQDNFFSLFAGTKSNAILELPDKLVLPINTTELFGDHFSTRSWTTPQAQVTAGYPVYIEPAAASGYYEEVKDYTPGTSDVISASTINITVNSTVVTAGGTLVVTISTSTDGTTYTTPVAGTSQFISNFKYVKFRVTATGGLYTITGINVKLESKLKTFAGNVSCAAGDSGGTIVYMTDDKTATGTKIFVDVDSLSIVLSPAVVSGVVPTAVYDFTDTVSPLSFKILLYNSQTGARLTGTCSYSVRGV